MPEILTATTIGNSMNLHVNMDSNDLRKQVEEDEKQDNKEKNKKFFLFQWFHSIYEFIISIIITILRFNLTMNKLLPKHIAFIMDGNRRWAKTKSLPIKEGHYCGYKKLKQCLNWCEKLGIKTVTVYAFAIDNFKREKTEVDNLMELLDKRFKDMITKKKSFIHRYKIILRVIGNFELLPNFVKESAKQAMEYSIKVNSKYGEDALILNLCCPYSSSFEIENAMCQSIKLKLFNKENVFCNNNILDIAATSVKEEKHDDNYEEISSIEPFVLTNTEPDIIVRTSGETRLSDFLTWQSEKSMIYFSTLLWPEFSFWQLVSIILQYQYYRYQTSLIK
ncbi:hypothetical protein ABK040_010864 [Willaertia magna]